ncbi:hypothetical protein CROQUDRAFT_134744 [Cronartium quercuum f. sp. fusiforme G11]|uniref:SAM domain-containing protein n=1 Tax=Cronartium quercuum f. sp. fusiforme G11 TaxID=708437 RepID=A0A9P6T959_9BASI|nr:hypothetical protein CROQUDRAFT_134744 [Cronartium quercuum f. sp. fusiforme G11]
MSDQQEIIKHSGSAQKSLVRPTWTPISNTIFKSGGLPHLTQSSQQSTSSHTSPVLKSPTGPFSAISSSSTGSIESQSSVQQFLHTLGLSEYLETFLNEGFDRLHSIEAITEEDLEYMGVKRGHRRILQRALATRGQLPGFPHITVQGLTTIPELRPYTPPESTTDLSSGLTTQKPSVPIESLLNAQEQNVSRPQGFSSTLPNQAQTNQQSLCVRTDVSLSQSIPASSAPAASNEVLQPTKRKRKYRRHPKPENVHLSCYAYMGLISNDYHRLSLPQPT